MTLDLIALVSFLAIALLALALASLALGRRRPAPAPAPEDDDRTASRTLWDAGTFEDDPRGRRRGRPGQPGAFVSGLAGLIPRRREEERRLRLELGHAGSYRRAALLEYLAFRNCLVLAVAIVAGMTAVGAADNSEVAVRIVLIGLVGVALVYSLPRLYIQGLGRARMRRIQRALPDALDLIAMCMAGGLSFQEALDRVARDVRVAHPDLATELRIVREHAALGSLAQAFRQFADRIDLPELKSLSAMIVQSERLGTSLLVPLDTFAADLRRDRRQRANAQANSAAIRMMLPMVLCLLPATLLLLWGPAALEMRDFWRREQAPGGAFTIAEEFTRPFNPEDAARPSPVEVEPTPSTAP